MKTKAMGRRKALGAILSTIAAPGIVKAQDSRPIEWVVGYAAGGGSDALARAVAESMSKILGQPIVVNNKPGAATNIAASYVANSKDYGNIMFTADFATLAANPWLFPKMSYNAEKDFEPVGMLARFPLLLIVGPNVQARNFQEFLAWAKSSPAGLSYASAGVGSPHHLAGELLKERAGLQNMQHIAYRGGAPAVQDLLGGQVPVGIIDTASVQQYLPQGKVRAIGVASPARLKNFPDVPTLVEQGLKDYTAFAWQGLVVQSGTPKETVARFSKALQAALDSTSVKARFQVLALESMPGTPQQMAAFAKQERERWGKVIRSANIKLD